jgi:hypothetical protein
MDSDGKEHSIARGAVASDGGGETRAYGHHITGSQHCLILFSLVTNKPTYVQNDQISCKQCSLAFTRSIKSKESHFENTRSKHNPATAEEWACEQAADFLLRDEESES